jgi:hypothetical protein
MNYRSPVTSMQRELETLEAELVALRTLPPAQPKSPQPPSKKARTAFERERRSLQSRLAKLEHQIEKRSKERGVRTLTARERASSLSMYRTGLGCIVAGAAVLCFHLTHAAQSRLVWVETTCAIEVDDEVNVASYRVGGHTYRFLPHAENLPAVTRCFVPGPSVLENVGRVERPTTPVVPFTDKLSFWWISAAAFTASLGVFFLLIERWDRRKRETCQVDPDDFSSSD